MRSVRISILTFFAAALVALAVGVPVASAAGFGFSKFFAGNCKVGFEECGKGANEGNKESAEKEGYRQAGGFVPYGVTDFKVASSEIPAVDNGGLPGQFVPNESIKNLRVDVAPGVVTNPQAAPRCAVSDFTGTEVEAGIFTEPKCPESSIIGKQEVETVLEVATGIFADVPLSGNVYNLEQASGEGSTYGVALEVPGKGVYVHSIIKGSVEFASDYHDYFVINNISPGLLESRLVFYGNENPKTHQKWGLVRNSTSCTAVPSETTTTVRAESSSGAFAERAYPSPVGTVGCESLKFEPAFSLLGETTTSDAPDGITAKLTAEHPESGVDTADLKSITVKMPEGMTMNPSAGAGLSGCTPEQAEVSKSSTAFEIAPLKPIGCPGSSRIGTVNLEVPTLPEGSLRGAIYLGKPAGKSIEGPPYTIYLAPETPRYGIRVLLEGTVTPNSSTGQLSVTFNKNPQAPFNDVVLHFNGGVYAPIANPLACNTQKSNVQLASFAGPSLMEEPSFTTESCAGNQFAPTQSTSVVPTAGGSDTGFVFTLTRPEGQQYVEKLTTVLPPGLVGKIPTVTQCTEAQASATQASGQGCPLSSQIGAVTATAGSGEPYPFNGAVYLTGPYQGAPYGLAFKVPVVAGPFNLGEEITRAKINVEPYSSRVIVTSTLPTIRDGIPTRLRSLTVSVNRPNYIINPTNCQLEAVESSVVSTLGTTANLASPFQVEGCGGLAFKPSFSAKTTGKTSKANGASLETTINQPGGQANIKSVLVTLPKQLPSRLTTLQKACPEATFAANPFACPAGSFVGTARANTPVLPTKMVGPAIFVSHGGEAFPDLDLVLQADGITVIVVGNTKITKGITTTNFATAPDVPVTSITVDLPTASNSALAANGNLCVPTLVMPTVITGQNGGQVKQNTKIAITGCGVQVVGHKLVGRTAFLTIKTFAKGRISASGSGVGNTSRTLNTASNATTLKVSLSRGAPRRTKIRVGFTSKQKGIGNSSATITVG
jgi:hypothetical protein